MATRKKTIPFYILEILKQYSDADHRFSQKDIIDRLKRDYELEIDRKTVRRNIQMLLDCGCSINYEATTRKTEKKDGTLQEFTVLSDFYLERDFSESELRFLMDGLLFLGHISEEQKKDMLKKLEGLSSQYFSSRMQYVHTLSSKINTNKQLFYTVEILDEAIQYEKQVHFHYCHFETDKKLHAALGEDGKPKWYTINPYQIVAASGNYYLICNYDKYDNLSNFRLDRIKDIEMLETSVKPIKSLQDMKNGFNLQNYMDEQLYMFSGKKYLLLLPPRNFF